MYNVHVPLGSSGICFRSVFEFRDPIVNIKKGKGVHGVGQLYSFLRSKSITRVLKARGVLNSRIFGKRP